MNQRRHADPSRIRRIAQVKFVALPLEIAPSPASPRSAGWLSALRSYLFRVIGCPEAARP
ncbi:MAG TPA: hypothetical protein VEC19_19065 [Usitatibacter sp.]|nr:hypothetical protein [Usitatibacter sp.]